MRDIDEKNGNYVTELIRKNNWFQSFVNKTSSIL